MIGYEDPEHLHSDDDLFEDKPMRFAGKQSSNLMRRCYAAALSATMGEEMEVYIEKLR